MVKMSDDIQKIKDSMEASLAELKQKREELALQIKLGSMEAREEWDKLEHKMKDMDRHWHQFQVEAGLGDSAEKIGSAMKALGTELKSGYDRLKEAL